MTENSYQNSVSRRYLNLREQVLEYSNINMNLRLENDRQVYIAVFDVPLSSGIIGSQTQTLALIFGLNAHIYHGSGEVITDLEKNESVMKAMQSLFVSCPQVLNGMQLTSNIEYYDGDKVRAYLKTRKGIYFKELDSENKEDRFLTMLMENVLVKIAAVLSEN